MLVEYRQLNNEDELTDEEFESIAGLIYDTDAYIYPAMFETREKAQRLIPELIKTNDSMFHLNNFFIAKYNNKIVGLVLWTKGSLVWSKEHFINISNKFRIGISKYLDFVTEKYVRSYEQATTEDTIAIINFCVTADMRNTKIGSHMMEKFLYEHKDQHLELCVLEENPSAVRLYKKYGFEETSRYGGFSVDNRKLICIGMERKE